jgi:TolA-binding protein
VTVVDLHPEDLLEKDAHGVLEPGERARLEAHLRHCVACRMERQLRVDFASELETEVAIERVGLGIEQLPDTPPPRESIMVRRGPRRRRHRAVWLLAAAVLLVGGAAAAAMGLSETRWVVLPATPSAPADTSPTSANNVKGHRAAVAAVVAADVPEPTPVEAPADPVVAAPAAPAVAPSRPLRAAPVAAPAVVIGPAELFDTATEARRRSDYGRSLDLDRELEQRYPTSSEAQVSRAIVGRLLLDRGDPTGALAKFDSYLAAGGGDLGEEAMVGRATALDRLGKADEATRAWSALVAAFPDSPYAARARARLENSNGR